MSWDMMVFKFKGSPATLWGAAMVVRTRLSEHAADDLPRHQCNSPQNPEEVGNQLVSGTRS